MLCWKKCIAENITSLYDLFKHTPQRSSEALPLLREKAWYLPMDLFEQVLIVVFIISNNQWLSFPFSLPHLTQWIKQAVNGSRPSLALSLWQHALILLFKHFFWDRCPVSALETSVYYSWDEEFQEKYLCNIHDGVFYHSCYSHALLACQPSEMCLFWGPTHSRLQFSVHLEWTLPQVW